MPEGSMGYDAYMDALVEEAGMGHTIDPKRIGEVLDACESEMGSLSKWEQGFIESVSDQYANRGFLSEKQLEILERIYLKI